MSHPFDQFDLQSYLMTAIKEIGFEEPTNIQEKVIPLIQEGRDVIGQSQTGSGKSHAFLLPILNKIDPDKEEVQALIAAPSRELADQLYEKALELAAFSEKEIVVQMYVGGTEKSRQIEKLSGNQPHIAIGTPGRLYDLVERNALLIYKATMFVVDEADMTLDMGFLEEVDKIATRLPENLQMLVFSATIPESLQPFLRKYMDNPVMIQTGSKEGLSDTVENWLISTQGKNKLNLVYDVLTMGQPFMALIFANTKSMVDDLEKGLQEKGLKVAKIHGGIEPRERRRVMRQIQNMEYQYIVATDLAARGIDIEGVSHVLNVEIPKDLSFFIHRSGRTGRNEMDGIAVTFYDPGEEAQIEELEEMGVVFKPKAIKKGQVIDTYDRKRRAQRKDKGASDPFDTELHGMRVKAKKNVKPGYKKKIKYIADQKKQRERRKR